MCLLCCRLLLPRLIRQRRRHAVSNRGRGRRWRLSLCHVVCSRLHGCLQGRLGWPWRSRCGTRLIIKQLPPHQDATVSVARPSVGSPMLPCRIMIRLAQRSGCLSLLQLQRSAQVATRTNTQEHATHHTTMRSCRTWDMREEARELSRSVMYFLTACSLASTTPPTRASI